MLIGITSALSKFRKTSLPFIKDNLKLYLDFKSNKSDTLKFPSEGSTAYSSSTSTFINFGDNDTLNMGTSSFTLAGWVKLGASSSTSRMMLGKTQNASGAKWSFGVNGGEKAFISISDGSTSANEAGATTISIGEWVHVVGVYDTDADTLSLFLNGVQDATMSASGIGSLSNSLDLRSGRGTEYPVNYNNDFDVCNLAIWKRALEPEEVQSIMNKSYSQLKGVEKTSLVSWWALDTETLSDNLATSWANAAGDAEVFTTSGANITSLVNSDGQVNVTTNSFATRYRVYKVSYDYTLVSGDHPFFFTATNTSQDGNVSVSSTFASLGSSWYFTADTGTNFAIWRNSNFSISVDNFSIQAVISADSHGSNTGYYSSAKSSAVSSHNSATTTTLVYGGNAPILPRAVDVAKEGQADAIGNGSASFSGGTDYIEIDSSNFPNLQPYTISAWFKIDTLQASAILAWGDETLYERRAMFIWNGGSGSVWKLIPSIYGENPVGATALEINRWYHGALVVDPTAKTYEIYLNGILDGSGSFSNNFVSWSGTTGYIGKTGSSNEEFDGNISQVGLWQGALTQAQIQSVMESTSYSKIPADVKSTLGSEISGDPTFDNASNWTISLGNGGVDVNTTVSGKLSVVNAQDTRLQKYSILTVGKLYKVTFVIDSYSSGRVRGLLDTAITFIPTGAGTYTRYFVASQTYFLLSFDSTANMTMTDISIKEVTNDIVAYYPLDGDSSANGVTQDVTTGEVLGTNLFTDSTFDLSGTQSASTTGTHWTTGSAWTIANGEAIYDATAHENRLELPSATLQSAGLYKFSFTVSDANTKAAFKIKADGNDIISTAYYDNGDHVIYYNQAGAYGSPKTIKIEARNDVHGAFKLQNASWELVTSNTGVLK